MKHNRITKVESPLDFTKPSFHLFADGAISYKMKKGGIGIVLLHTSMKDREHYEYSESFDEKEGIVVTNNRMELKAVITSIQLLDQLKSVVNETFYNDPIFVHSDSAYVVNNFNSHLKRWMMTNWETREGTPIQNQDLWKELWFSAKKYKNLTIIHEKGHSGEMYTELSDSIAQIAAHGKEVNKKIKH